MASKGVKTMAIQFQLDSSLVYSIGINFVEIPACFLFFGMFLFNARRGDVGKGMRGSLSAQMGLSICLLGVSRIYFVKFDYITPDVTNTGTGEVPPHTCYCFFNSP